MLGLMGVGAAGSLAAGKAPRSFTDVHLCSDFAVQSTGFFFSPGGITGKGSNTSVYRMRPHTSTKAGIVAGLQPGQTNPFYLMRACGMNSGQVPNAPNIGGFTLQGTDQGHLYGGLVIGYSTNATVHDIKATGIPGNSSGPPGETFTVSLWHANGFVASNLVLDGRRSGTPVAASVFATNSVVGGSVSNLRSNYAQYGFAAALWDSANLSFANCGFQHCRKAINIEGTRAGTYDFHNCDFRNTWGAPYIAQISSAAGTPNAGSAKVTFYDPVVDALPVQVRVYPTAPGNMQKNSDIHCVMNGVDVTNDPNKFLLVTSG